MKLMKRPVQSTRSTESCMSLQFWCAEDPCRSEGVCVCVWTSVTKRTQGFCNNLAHQLIEHAKISSMFYCILAGGPRAHHTARANEALYDEARKTYLQTSSWVLDWSHFMQYSCHHRCHVQLQTKQTRISLEPRLAPEPLEVNLPMMHEAVLDFQRISGCEMDA